MKIQCPICGSPLQHTRIDDGTIVSAISINCEVTELANESNGSDTVYCTKVSSHKIGYELEQQALDLIWSHIS